MAKRKRYFNKQFKVNLTEESYTRVSLLAEEKGLTKSEFVRELLNEKTENAQLPEKKEIQVVYKIDKEFLLQYAGVARNINQIARRLNAENIFEAQLLLRVEEKIDTLIMYAKNENKGKKCIGK